MGGRQLVQHMQRGIDQLWLSQRTPERRRNIALCCVSSPIQR
jgi:hypothetical protein